MSENYKGTIELISGLKQKNNVDFPLMEAHAVAVYETDALGATTEIRLDEKLKKLKEESSVSETAKKEIIDAAVDAVFVDEDYTNLKDSVEKNSTAIFAAESGLDYRVKELETQIEEGDNKELKLQYEEKESMLYLYTGDELIKPNPDDETIISNVISSTTVSGGGSGASLNYRLTLKILDDSSNLTFLHTDTPKIKYIANFIDTSVEEGEDNLVSQTLNFKMTVTLPSGAKNTYSFTGMSNTELEYDLSSILSTQSGLILGDHNITLTVSYTQEVGDEATPVTIQSTKKWIVKVTQMYLESSFDDSGIKTGNVPLTVTVYGDLNKTIHYKFNGVDDWMVIENASLSNYDYSISIPKQSHGNYPLEIYLTAEVNNKTIRSDSLFYDIMFIEENFSIPVIRAVPASSKGQQYSNLAIEYSVYTPNSLISVVELAVDGKVVSTLDNVDRSEHIWNYKPLTEGTKTLTITSGPTTKTLVIEVEKLPYTIEGVTAGLELDFLPQGRTNQDADYNIFHNNVFDEEGNEVPLTWTLSDNFDWINGGWKTDEKGENYFCIKAGTSVDINYLLFNDEHTLVGNNKAKGNGKEFKIIFKTTNVANADTTWLSCMADPDIGSTLGLQMDAHTGYVHTSAGTNLAIPYSEEDKIEFDMNIVPITYDAAGAIDLTIQDIPMIMTYEDGTPVRPLILNNDQITFKQKEAVPITIGSPYCDVHIYRMKAYSTFLSDRNILNNFIADASDAEEMVARYERNQIYDSKTGKLTPESYAAACPNTKVIKISAPRFTNDKKDKVLETTIEMIHKNGDPVLDNWIAINAVHNGQGTSSNAYGYAGRNLELNLKVKETPRYKITKAEGVYDEDGEHIAYGSILEGKQDFYDAEGVKYEDPSTIATVTIIPGTTITLGDGVTTVKEVSLTRDSVPTNYFNVKVNIASSEHANNALLQKRYDRYLPYTPYAKSRDEKIKNNMNFYNCVVFIQERNEDLTTHQEFNDNEWHFYSIGNIGDSKKTDDTRTSDPEDPNEFCVEIMDWNRELSAFPKDTKVAAMAEKYVKKDNDGNITKYIFATQENLEAGILFERTGGRYVEFPKDGSFNGFEYYFELVDGEYILTQDTKNDGIKTYYEYVGGTYGVSQDEIIDHKKPYYVDILEQDDFSEDYTYGWRYALDDEDPEILASCKAKWIEFYRFITKDLSYDDQRTDEEGNILEDPSKIAAWKEELKDWFVIDAAFYYYLFTLRYTMVDNRAKNSFWHYGKQGSGYKFDFWDYDNDTALGIDNTGKFTMGYGVEDHDTNEGGAAHFRAHNSTFFVRVADYFADELITYFKDTLENKNAAVFNSTSLINEFDTWQSEFPEEIWRKQYERIYKRTYVGGYGSQWDNAVNPAQIKKAADPQFLVEMMNGKKKYQRRQFERNQDVYMSSKFFGNTVFQDMLTLRGGGDMDPSKFVVKPNGDITITPYLNMYINTGVENNKFNHHVKVNAGESVTLKYPTSALEFNYIWGASYLQSLGDLSAMYLRVAKLGQGQRMKQLILGNPTEGYNNPNLDNVEITSNNRLLEELDVRNMSNLGGNIPINTIASLRKLYAQGTNYQTVQFANNGLMEEAYLPASINKIVANNLYYLHTLSVEDYSNLQYLLIDNCPNIDEYQIVINSPNLKTIRLTNIDWDLNDSELLNRLLLCSGVGEDGSTGIPQSVLTGKVHLAVIRAAELAAYQEAWPELEVTYDKEIPQYSLIFKNNNETIYTVLKDEGTVLSEIDDPVANGTIEPPTIPDSEDGQFTYTFKEWKTIEGKAFIGTTVTNADITFHANYTESIKNYSVKWYSDTNKKTVLQESLVPWGQNAVYTGLIPTKTPSGNDYFLFEKWDKTSTNVKTNIDIVPEWATSNPNQVGSIATQDLTAIDLYGLKQVNTISSKFANIGDILTLQMGYMPSYSNIEDRILIDKATSFNGTDQYINTNVSLFDEDKSFVLALDFEMAYAGGTLVACYYQNTNGFAIGSTSGNIPTLTYKQANSKTNVGHKAPTSDRNHREICVIRKVKGDNTLYIYTNDRYSLTEVQRVDLLPSDTFGPISNKLGLGAVLSSNGTPSNYGAGTIYYAKLWFDDLGDEDCRKICAWTYEKQEFEYIGSGFHIYENSDVKTQATFVAKNLLDETMPLNNISSSTENSLKGYGPSELRQWLQAKPFAGASITWRQTISKAQVPILLGKPNDYTDITGELYYENGVIPSDYFYIPSAADLDSTYAADGIYSSETTAGINYPIFASNVDRIKTLGNTDIEAAYWSRSPYEDNINTMLGVLPKNDDESTKPQGSLHRYYRYQGQYSYFYTYNVSNSNHGILIAFSI